MEHPRRVLERYGLRARKSLGQNFLFDDGILDRIAAAADVAPGDELLEIGPGLGSLTGVLADRGARVVAIEKDAALLPVLRDYLGEGSVELVHGDILEFDPKEHFGDRTYKAIGNLPYYITGAILRHLLQEVRPPGRLVFTVQREVADRLLAPPGQLSLLAISVRYFGDPLLVGTVGAGAFWPRPGVDSAILRLDVREPTGRVVSPERFFHVVRAGFAQKRKQLKNNLRGVANDEATLQAALDEAGVDGRRRAETLGLEEWLALARALTP